MNLRMRFILVNVLCLISISKVIAQDFQWNLLAGSPGTTGVARFEDMYFINPITGWVVGYTGKVYRTTNAGTNWSVIFTSTFGVEFRSVGFFDSTTGLIGTLIDTTKILYRTTNGGFNWSQVTNFTGRKPQGICGMSIVNSNTAYAVGRYYGSGRVIKSTDRGVTWNTVFNDSSLARTLIDCYFWTPDSGIAVGGYNTSMYVNGNAVVIKTTNGGLTWARMHKTSRTGEWCWKISFINRNTGFVSIERESGFAYFLKTTNNGDNWVDIPFRVYDEEGIGFVNENTGWIGGWTGPTYQTTNGGANWVQVSWGYNLNRFRFLSDTLGYAVGDRVYKYSRGPVSIFQVSSGIPASFTLHQNYPNPFNPNTKIKFDIPINLSGEKVSLIIFDALGREIETIVDNELAAGSYSVELSADDLSSGIYFYSIAAGESAVTRKMILLK